MLGSREWGEDALQLTFVAAYKALRRGGCDGALRPWLYAIARNCCLSELRARREIPDSDRVSAESPTIDGPAIQFARREQLGEIVQDIQRLPADQRAALVLFELRDLSHEEIATVLGVRREKVKALIFQAREGLYRSRTARETSCSEVRERLANERGKAPARGVVRAHIDRCACCQAFEREVRRQRAALALVLPVALGGKLKALVLSSALGQGSVGGAVAGTGAGAAGSLPAASTAGSGSGLVAGSGSLGAGAAASGAGSASTGGGVVAGASAAASSSAASATASSAAPTIVASALGSDAVAGALTSSVPVASVAKLATVLAVVAGVGGVTRSALTPSPRPQVSVFTDQPAHATPLRSPLQPFGSGTSNPLAGATQPGPQPGMGAAAPTAAASTVAASTVAPSSNAPPSFSVGSAAVSAPSPPDAGGLASAVGTTSAPAASTPSDGAVTTTAPSPVNSTTTAGTPTTTGASPTHSGTNPSTTTTASSPTTTTTGSSSASSPSQGTPGASSGTSTNGSSHATGQDQPSGSDPGSGVTHPNGNGPPITPPGCVNNPGLALGCLPKPRGP
jgi:RNA polymerase sigma factor (sigma-70 family)